MKTENLLKTILVAIFVALVGISSSYASGPEKTDACQLLKETLFYPDFAIKEGIEGSVEVDFTVGDDGILDLRKVDAVNPALVEVVKERISGLDLNQTNLQKFTTYKITFKFELEQ